MLIVENHSEIYNKLIKFQDQNVPLAQIEILEKLYEGRGTIMPAKKILSAQKESQAENMVDESYIIHNLFQGVYKPKSSDFAQCVISNPRSGRKLPIDMDSSTLKLKYEFDDKPNHRSQIKALQKCKDIDLPVGMLFQIKASSYMVLGLLKITSIVGLKVALESYELSDEESALLKEKTLSAYQKSLDPSVKPTPNANYSDLIKRIDEVDLNQDYKLQSDTVKIPHLINYCEKGQWVIPNFQRYFDWDKNQVRKFLNSVFYGYYVGALLIWYTTDKSSIGVKPISGVDIKLDDLHTDRIILDGQQRITSLYYAIRSPEIDRDKIKSYFYINFAEFFSPKPDEIIEAFPSKLSQKECFSKFLFPFNRLLDYEKWIDDFEDFLVNNTDLKLKDDIRPLRRKIISKLNFIKERFTISYITLADMPISDVVHVFERINTTGKQLDAFDLLIAKMSIYDIDLRELWDSACKYSKINEYFDRPKGSTKGLVIFQTMALCYTESRSCKHDNILKIFTQSSENKEDFLDKWNVMLKGVNGAIKRLELIADTGFGVISRSWLPFEPMIPVLAALIHLIETNYKNKQKACYEKLEQWYWISVFSNTYSSGANTQKTHDYNLMKEWFDTDEIPEEFKTFQRDFDHILNLSQAESTKGSVFRGVLSLLALAGSKDWCTNAPVLSREIFENDKVHVDHIFPKSKYNKEPFNESILNKTWLYGETNNKKSARKPSEFIDQMRSESFSGDDNDFKKTMSSHFISEEAFAALKKDDHKTFVIEREKTILQEIARRIGSKKTDF